MANPEFPLPVLVIAVAILFVVVIGVVQARRRARANEELAREAAMRGWQLEVVRRGHIIRGQSRSVSWTFERIRQRRQRGTLAGWWHTDPVRKDGGTIEIWPASAGDGAAKMAELDPGNPLIKLLLFAVIRMLRASSSDAPHLVGLKRVDIPGPLAQQRIVMARNPEDGKAFLEAGGERALLAWSESRPYELATAILWHRGVELIVNVPTLNLERLEAVARLGADLAEASRRAKSDVSAQY